MSEYSGQYKDSIIEIYNFIKQKVMVQCERLDGVIPYVPVDGHYIDMGEKNIFWWTNGFWGGLLWQMFSATQDDRLKNQAKQIEKRLDDALCCYEKLDHDVGFLWQLTAVADYRLMGDAYSRRRALRAAIALAGRYNPAGRFLVAWNDSDSETKNGWMIIDTMMNLCLLYWASEETGDPRYRQIAMNHADTVLDVLIREDGSSGHIALFDAVKGTCCGYLTGQGFNEKSSWSRGQAWAMYGMALSYFHTREERYLRSAKKTAEYFLKNISDNNYLARIDFEAPEQLYDLDTSASACAACGLILLAECVPESVDYYMEEAAKIIINLNKYACNYDMGTDGILKHGTCAYHRQEEKDVSLIYGDYFFVEAVLKLMGNSFMIW